MGWFNKTVTLTEYDIKDALRKIGLDPYASPADEDKWRLRMFDSSLPDIDGALVGYIKNEGTSVGVFVDKRRVGQVDDRSLMMAVPIFKKYRTPTVPCALSNMGTHWNVYINML